MAKQSRQQIFQDSTRAGVRVAICVPCRDTVMAGFAFDLAKLCAYEGFRGELAGLSIYQMPGTMIFDQRNKLAQQAIDEGADWILWIDSDMRFPKDTLQILLSRELPIVGVNATTRMHPVKPTSLNLEFNEEGLKKLVKVNSKGKEGLEQVMGCGFGLVLTHKDVYDKMPTPWFAFMESGVGGWIGEDIHFCAKASDYGFPTFIDHELSMHIKHIGVYEYGWDDYT